GGGLEVPLGGEARARQLERLLAESVRCPALAAQAHERAVRRDAIEPARELRFSSEERQLLIRVEEGFLQHFLRVRLRAGHAQGEPVELPLVPLDERRERFAVALLGALDE